MLRPFKRELIEQSSLFDLPMSHHDLQSCLSQRLNQRISFRATADFFNRIGQKRTRRQLRAMSALSPCVDGSELARTFFTYAALVGAPVCSAFQRGSHDRWP